MKAKQNKSLGSNDDFQAAFRVAPFMICVLRSMDSEVSCKGKFMAECGRQKA